MSKKHFSWLLIITIVVAVIVMLIPGKTGNESVFESQPLFPALTERVNDINEVRIVTADPEKSISLQRKENRWVVTEAAGYPANWEILKTLLRDLTEARIVESKTSKAEFYSRLGVEDIDQADASGILLEFGGAGDMASVIVGKKAEGRQGQYVRLAGNEQSALIGSQLNVPRDVQQWLEREIVDVPATEVVEFEIVHPDGETVRASKTSADDADYVLDAIPEGREISSAWAVNQVGGALAALQLDGVGRVDDIDWTEAVIFNVLTADGLKVSARLTASEEEHWISLTASEYPDRDQAQAQAQSEPQTEPQTGSAADPSDQPESEPGTEVAMDGDTVNLSAAESIVQRVDMINQRVDGWAYKIPSYKYDSMVKRQEAMLKSIEDSQP
jgi:hypothetical protein